MEKGNIIHDEWDYETDNIQGWMHDSGCLRNLYYVIQCWGQLGNLDKMDNLSG